MKKNTLGILLVFTLFSACKKKDTPPDTSPATLTLNGTTYHTVVIGNLRWTTENYDGPGGVPSPRNIEATTGKFYSIAEVDALKLPDGWRVPTEADFINLLKSQGTVTEYTHGVFYLDPVAARHLRATSLWGIPGDNQSGFNAQGTGSYNSFVNEFPNFNAYATFWSSTVTPDTGDGPDRALLILIAYINQGAGLQHVESTTVDPTYNGKSLGYNLRFVKSN
ncbi:MAG: FISUMP domain-containing protein [Bacteroidota bacterium]